MIITQATEYRGFVSGYRFSDTGSLSKSDAPLGAAITDPTFSAASTILKVHP